MKRTLYILGAEDPEMNAIEDLLRQCGQQVTYALTGEGKRVTPMSAYGQTFIPPNMEWEGKDIVTVECDTPNLPGCGKITLVDHHRAGEYPMHAGFCDCGSNFRGYGTENACLQCGKVWRGADPGYGKPPGKYWGASSIGQIVSMLPHAWGPCLGCGGADVHRLINGTECQVCGAICSADYLGVIAAADHCLAAAYAGQCPGVDPTKLAEFRVEQLCSASRASNRENARTPDEVRASIKSASEVILAAPQINLGGVMLADLRGAEIPDLPEAAMLLGIGYLAGGVSLRESDPPKIVIGGCGAGTIPGTAPVEAFLAAARTGQIASTPVHVDGQLKPYGDPVRGFAGAYNLL